MKVIIAAGGTGGHIYPGISIAEKLKEKGAEVLFLGTDKGMEANIVPRYGFRLVTIRTGQFAGKNLGTKAKTLTKVLMGILDCLRIVKKEKANAILGMGGFVSFPCILAGKLVGVDCFLHEQNLTLGLANRILYRGVKKIFLSFEETAKLYSIRNYKYTGNPVRKVIKKATHKKPNGKFRILVFGGSRGAKRINQAMVELLPLIDDRDLFAIYHQTGSEDLEWVREAYLKNSISGEIFSFTEEMGYYLGLSDLVISRAGSSTIFELACTKKPAILVPYPYSAGKHQLKNALYVERLGAAYVIADGELSGEVLYRKLMELSRNPDILKAMGERMGQIYVDDAEERIANEILGLGS